MAFQENLKMQLSCISATFRVLDIDLLQKIFTSQQALSYACPGGKTAAVSGIYWVLLLLLLKGGHTSRSDHHLYNMQSADVRLSIQLMLKTEQLKPNRFGPVMQYTTLVQSSIGVIHRP
jgi:hypothetical protein